MFLDFSIWTFKSPKIASELALPVSANSYTGVLNSYTGVCELVYRCLELVYRCLRTRIPVFAKSYTAHTFCVGTRLPVSANSYTGVCELVYRCLELVYRCLRTRIPVSANSYTGVCEMVYSHPSIRFHKHRYTSSRHRYTSSQTPVYEFANTGIRVHRHRYTSSQTPEARVLVFKGHFQVLKGPDLQKSMLKGHFSST